MQPHIGANLPSDNFINLPNSNTPVLKLTLLLLAFMKQWKIRYQNLLDAILLMCILMSSLSFQNKTKHFQECNETKHETYTLLLTRISILTPILVKSTLHSPWYPILSYLW